MKTITRISLIILSAVMLTVCISSCATGNAAARHTGHASGSTQY